MTDDSGRSVWAPRPDADGERRPRVVPSGVADEWVPPAQDPGSSLAPPPDRTDPRLPAAMPTVSTGPIEAGAAVPTRWIGRGAALLVAAALVAGGGYLALNAGSAAGGADSPQGALEGVLDALSHEDLIGAAEFVEPTERELLIDAGIDIAAELVRLGVLAGDLDLASIRGIDFQVDDLELSSAVVAPGLAHVFVDGGRISGSIDVARLPLGPLVLDRAPSDFLDYREATSETVDGWGRPVVAVERDGHWYLSLWYSVAENLRIDNNQSLPDPGARVVAVGADSPEHAIEQLLDAFVDLDLVAVIGLVDPQEAAALYDYAPLFLDDAQRAITDIRGQLRDDNWLWAVTDLGLSSVVDGDLAEVVIESFAFAASSEDTSVDVRLGAGEFSLLVRNRFSVTEIRSDGDCIITTFEDQYDTQSERFCADDPRGLGLLSGGAMANLQFLPDAGVVTHRIDGRWFVSPTRTGSNAVLAALAAIEPEALAATIDAFVELAEGPWALRGSAALGPGDVVLPVPMPPTSPRLEAEPLTTDNLDMVVGDRRVQFAFDLDVRSAHNDIQFWAPGTTEIGFTRGVHAELVIGGSRDNLPSLAVVVIIEGVVPPSGLAPIDLIVPGEYVEGDSGAPPYVLTESDAGSPVFAARTETGIVLVGGYRAPADMLLAVLREQVNG